MYLQLNGEYKISCFGKSIDEELQDETMLEVSKHKNWGLIEI